MSLYRDNSVDPIGVLNQGRELSVCPVHFYKITGGQYKTNSQIREIRSWIWKHLSGRFSISADFVAFEDPSEASMFALIKDQFDNNFNF
jgi:hypothetical protein